MSGDVLKGVAAVLGPVLILAGVIYTQRQGRRTSDTGQALDAWRELLEPIRTRLTDVEQQLVEQQVWRSTAEPELHAQRAWRQTAIGYIRRLVSTHHDPPAPPEGFDLDETESR